VSADRSQQVVLAEGLARQEQVGPAVEACYAALRLDTTQPHAHALLAELMLAGDFYDEAIAAATQAIELDPDCAPAYLALGLAYDRRGGMWDQSILVWHELAEVVPDLVTAHVQLGEAFSLAAFDEEAIESWRRALELDPTEARAMYNLAVAALKREGVPTALPGFRKAGELDPSQDELFFDLAHIGQLPRKLPDPSKVAGDLRPVSSLGPRTTSAPPTWCARSSTRRRTTRMPSRCPPTCI
jgi:tetratricopeptide (TPR) repeat protein